MNVFKFGGASVKDASAVRNVLTVLRKTGPKNKLVVVSAMGKTTNALERVIQDYLNQKGSEKQALQEVITYHEGIIDELFPKGHEIHQKVATWFDGLLHFLSWNKSTTYDFVYDQIICFGELISTTIISEFLSLHDIKNHWIDAREYVKTNDVYRDANVDWEGSYEAIQTIDARDTLTITQGFIGSQQNNFTTTLGREGSDYTAAIFAYCLNANDVTIWKDVPGVLNGDPRVFKDTQLLHQISYEEAIELAFYGASVIHPKTLQPLQRKEIPLYVKSFLHPENPGTAVSKGQVIDPLIPCFIVKKAQVLISLSSLDFSFIVEDNISEIFSLFHKYQIKVDLIQNSAISFSICIDNRFNLLEKLINHLKAKFKVTFTKDVSLYTIRHFTQDAIDTIESGKEVLLKQLTQETIQLVIKE
ncbi:aspartate kinase [Gangjinia marincola]|uniref:Aspartokinase n=1 Tax=Gangjinia marincola TaxID=578463 RepID=A0ABP3XX31_9FLAO